MRQPGHGWTLAAADAQPWRDAPVDQLLNAESVPVRLPLSTAAQRLPRFSAVSVESISSCPATTTTAAATPPQQQQEQQQQQQEEAAVFNIDSVLFAGGPVWTLDWCPLLRGPGPGPDADAGPLHAVEALALSTHPASARRNPVGAAQSGPGAVQVWGVPSSSESTLVPGGLPQLLALLWHEGRLAWDLAWCPDPSAFIYTSSNTSGLMQQRDGSGSGSGSDGGLPLQGLLAAVLGNGHVVVWGVPTIKCLTDLGDTEAADGDDEQQQQQQQQPKALSLRLPPVWECRAAAVGGSLASCCSWLPSAPHDKLLVGCWDGTVVVWQLSVGQGGVAAAAPVQLVAADTAPIRAVAWQPDLRWWLTGTQQQQQQQQQQQEGGGSPGSQLFITGSSNGNIKVWDVHDVLQPCQERLLSRAAINAALWLGPPHVWLTASADGVIRTLWVDAGVQATGTAVTTADVSGACGAVWALSASPRMAVAAYVSDGGLLGLMPLEPSSGEARHRKSHAALSALTLVDDELWVLSAREIPSNGGLYTAASAWRAEGGSGKKVEAPDVVVVDPLPHPDQVLYGVAFSPNYRGLAMLAAGGGAGLVRLHAVEAQVVPAGW